MSVGYEKLCRTCRKEIVPASNFHCVDFEPTLLLTPVPISSVKTVSVGTAIYLGMKIFNHPVTVKNPVPSKFAWHT